LPFYIYCLGKLLFQSLENKTSDKRLCRIVVTRITFYSNGNKDAFPSLITLSLEVKSLSYRGYREYPNKYPPHCQATAYLA
jgi:hypothetical protein